MNNNGISPYVSDPAALLRTDIFPGAAWLAPAHLFSDEFLKRWPESRWDAYMRSPAGRAGRQCLVPEMPRVKHYSASSYTHGSMDALKDATLHDAKLFFSCQSRVAC